MKKRQYVEKFFLKTNKTSTTKKHLQVGLFKWVLLGFLVGFLGWFFFMPTFGGRGLALGKIICILLMFLIQVSEKNQLINFLIDELVFYFQWSRQMKMTLDEIL